MFFLRILLCACCLILPLSGSDCALPDETTAPPPLTSAPAPAQFQPVEPHLYAPIQSESLVEQAQLRKEFLKPICSSDAGYTINFEDISIIQLIQFISKISGINYIYDSNDLQFNITIVSADPTSVEDLTAALLQVLKMHNLSVTEQGRNVLIYKNQNVSKVSKVITDENINEACDSALITRVFYLSNLEPDRMQAIVKPLLSPDAVVDISPETRHLIVTDITTNVAKIADLLNALDTPSAILDVAEYDVQGEFPEVLAEYAREILLPMADNHPFQLIPQPTARKIFIVSSPFLINKAMQVLASLDTPEITAVADLPADSMENNHFYMYKLQYQDGRLIVDAMKDIGINLQHTGVMNPDFVNAIYSLQWIEVNNSIVIAGTEDSIQKVVELLLDLDQPPKQVFIEVLVIDTTLTNSLDFGVQWIALGDEQDKLAFASGLLSNQNVAPPIGGISRTTNPGARFVAGNPLNPGAAVPPSTPPLQPNPARDVPLPVPNDATGQLAAFGLGFIGNIIRHNGQSFLTLGALVSALDAESQTSIVLNPRIMTEDNVTADIFVGQNIPYQTTSTVIQQTGSVTQNIQYEDIGVHLRVTPTISPDNVVTLQIDQSVVELTPNGLITNNVIAPVTNKTLSTTRVHVPDGTFLVMSGHIRDEESCLRSGIPCLGTLPLIGPLFSRTVTSRGKRNLILFVRPKVVTSIQEGLDLTNQEGYDYNWETHPSSIIECTTEKAPECETYPPPACPDH